MNYKTLKSKIQGKKNQLILLPIEIIKGTIENDEVLFSLLDDIETNKKISKKEEQQVGLDKILKFEMSKKIFWKTDSFENEVDFFITFSNNKKYKIYLTYENIFKIKEIESLWVNDVFPNTKSGDLLVCVSPSVYLVKDFKQVFINGIINFPWDEILEEGTIVLVKEMVKIDQDIRLVKIFHNETFYWSFGYFLDMGRIMNYNPHYL